MSTVVIPEVTFGLRKLAGNRHFWKQTERSTEMLFFRSAHRKKVLARVRAYQKANAKHEAEAKQWYAANLERERAKGRERRRKARLTKAKQFAEENRKWYYTHLERNRATARERMRKARLAI